MVLDERCAFVAQMYGPTATDLRELWRRCADDIVFHIAGSHPLSGSHRGTAAVRGYLDAVQRVPGDHPGYTVTSVLEDRDNDLVLVEGTVRSGDPVFERTVVHLLRFRAGLLVELWDYPFDQQAEDRFWCEHVMRAVPGQRRPESTPPLRRV